jgi:hypothetical protein
MSKVTIEFKSKGNTAVYFDQLIEDSRDLFKNDAKELAQYESIQYEIKENKSINAKKLARLLTSALNDGDTDAIWYVIGELEKAAK